MHTYSMYIPGSWCIEKEMFIGGTHICTHTHTHTHTYMYTKLSRVVCDTHADVLLLDSATIYME